MPGREARDDEYEFLTSHPTNGIPVASPLPQEARDDMRAVIVGGFNAYATGAGASDLSGYLADLLAAAGYRKRPEPEAARDDEREALLAEAREALSERRITTWALDGGVERLIEALDRKHPEPEITDTFRAYVDHLGVDANEEHDGDEWWSGYRQAQRDNILRATAALGVPVEEGEQS